MTTVQQQVALIVYASSSEQMNKLIRSWQDGDLVKQAQAGNQVAFETLVERYRVPLLQYIASYLRDADQRSDVLQQVLIQLYLSLPDLRTEGTIQAWVFRVARNRCLDELRRRSVLHFSDLVGKQSEEEALLAEGAVLLAPSVEEQAEQHEVRDLISQAILDLPRKYQAIVWLRYTTQLTFGEIGRILHIPEATAKTYFQRAKLGLRQSLSQLLG